MEIDKLIGYVVKVNYRDGEKTKSIRGILESYEDGFLAVRGDITGKLVFINRDAITYIVEMGNGHRGD